MCALLKTLQRYRKVWGFQKRAFCFKPIFWKTALKQNLFVLGATRKTGKSIPYRLFLYRW
jgi:hypothetical protein